MYYLVYMNTIDATGRDAMNMTRHFALLCEPAFMAYTKVTAAATKLQHYMTSMVLWYRFQLCGIAGEDCLF